MKRLLDLIRRHPRLFAGSIVILLTGIALFSLRSTGSAHAAAGAIRASAKSSAAAPAPPRPAGRPAGFALANRATRASAVASHPRVQRTGAGGSTRRGLLTPAPSPSSLARALRAATGLSPAQVTAQTVCPPATNAHARCAGEVLVLRSDHGLVRPRTSARGAVVQRMPSSTGSATEPQPFTPEFLQQAYDLTSLSSTGGRSDTVAIVDVGDDPTAASDLATYRTAYGLGSCSGCLTKVNETGGTSPLPPPDSGWQAEESLDLDAVTAICPNCHILLVEASTSSLSDLNTAMQAAHRLGANQISDSWSAQVTPAQLSHIGTYTFPGVSTVAATGDTGYVNPNPNGDVYPAAFPGVTAAGGTTLAQITGAPRGFGEGAWSNADGAGGSGCDVNVGKPSYQADTGCLGRSYSDVSADADPETGLRVYSSAAGGWVYEGGTSLAAPLIAAYYAITGVDGSSPQWAYTNSGLLNDITSGSNGSCTISYICNAGPGFDGPTGVGSIFGDVVAGGPGIGGPAIGASQGASNTYVQSTRADGATITAGIYPNGLKTTWWIQYWLAGGGGVQQTPAANIGSGTAAVAVTGYPTHLKPGTTYDFQLVAENSGGPPSYGYTDSFTTSAGSAALPTAAFAPSPAPSIPGSTVNFDASGSSPATGDTITGYSWDFGDPSSASDTATGSNPTHVYANAGKYNVTLIVTDSDGQRESTTQTVTVDAPPTASFTTPATSPGAPVSFDASGSSDSFGAIQSYSWDIIGPSGSTSTGITASGVNPTESLARGTYSVSLTVTNDAGQSSTTNRTVTVDDAPSASITAPSSPTVTTPGTNVTFGATGSSPDAGGSIASYSWNFGDGNTSSDPAPPHSYASPGVYTVSVTATDDLGVSSPSASTTITVDAPPAASFTTTSTSPVAPVAFDASGSSDSVGTIQTYNWDIVGPSPSTTDASATTAVPTYNPTLARGSYQVTLTVTNDAGQTSPAATKRVIVDDAPSASITAPSSPTVTTSGTNVTFSATGSSPDAGGSIASYSWNFGDGNTSSDPVPPHSYASPGVYTVSVTATDDLGVSSPAVSTTVRVDAPPTASFSAAPNPVTAGSAIAFNAIASDSVGTITGYTWNFGDPNNAGNTATGPTPTHTYGTPGAYSVSLTVTNDAGQSTTRTGAVTVNSVPAPPTSTSTSTTTSTTLAPPPPSAPTPTPAPTPPTPAPAPTPTPSPLSAHLSGAKKQKLAPALAHGVRISLAINQNARATFQVILPQFESKLVRDKNGRSGPIVLLRSRAQTLGAGTHPITLKLPRAAAHELASTGSLVLTVKVTLTYAGGLTTTRSVKIKLTR